MQIFDAVHVGVAMDVENDLYVVVINNAGQRPVAEVATEAGPARLVLGRNYLIDADLEAAVARALGLERVVQEVLDPPQLALVG